MSFLPVFCHLRWVLPKDALNTFFSPFYLFPSGILSKLLVLTMSIMLADPSLHPHPPDLPQFQASSFLPALSSACCSRMLSLSAPPASRGIFLKHSWWCEGSQSGPVWQLLICYQEKASKSRNLAFIERKWHFIKKKNTSLFLGLCHEMATGPPRHMRFHRHTLSLQSTVKSLLRNMMWSVKPLARLALTTKCPSSLKVKEWGPGHLPPSLPPSGPLPVLNCVWQLPDVPVAQGLPGVKH